MAKKKNQGIDTPVDDVKQIHYIANGKLIPVKMGNITQPAVLCTVDEIEGVSVGDEGIFHLSGVRYAGVVSAIDVGADDSVCLSLTDGLKPV